MEIKLKWEYVCGQFDTKTMKLTCLPAREERMFSADEIDAEICIKNWMDICIANIHLGDVDSSNTLCKEICRRFNEFPEDLKL